MAAILQFQRKQDAEQRVFAVGHTAEILIYTGVRFERIDFDALRNDDANINMNSTPARLAN